MLDCFHNDTYRVADDDIQSYAIPLGWLHGNCCNSVVHPNVNTEFEVVEEVPRNQAKLGCDDDSWNRDGDCL